MTNQRLRPLSDRVAILPLEPPLKSKSGLLHIPSNAQGRSVRGDVIAVGPGRREEAETVPMELKVGDRVIYGQYSGMLVESQDETGEDILLIREGDVLAVVELKVTP